MPDAFDSRINDGHDATNSSALTLDLGSDQPISLASARSVRGVCRIQLEALRLMLIREQSSTQREHEVERRNRPIDRGDSDRVLVTSAQHWHQPLERLPLDFQLLHE